MKTDNKSQTPFHKSVLIKELIHYLDPQPGKLYIDATFGGGGHTRAILDSNPGCKVIAVDWDMKAIEQNAPPLEKLYKDRLTVLWGNFAQIYKLLKKEHVSQIDGLIADFGTSQFQIHEKAGFSFQKNTPLDMRMSPAHQPTTAADILNKYSKPELIKIFKMYGEEPQAQLIAKKIVEARQKKPFSTTNQLVELIELIINPKAFKAKRRIHPATRVFQALRIEVNNELDNIHSLLMTTLRFLAPQGRIVCISFHSLEDRLVKRFFREHTDQLEILTPKPITASEEELNQNPSSRSAKLRAAVKIFT